VQQNSSALRFVNRQTPELCMAAVCHDGYALLHVREQTPELCMAAVQQNGIVLEYVNEEFKTYKICKAAVH
jgi:hypothetical protein